MKRRALLALSLASACASQSVEPVREANVVRGRVHCADEVVSAVRPSQICAPDALVREERRIASAPGVSLFAMRIVSPLPLQPRRAVVLMHGAGSPSSAIWDVRHQDYSLMRALACAGFDAYAIDARGFGGSTMPEVMAGKAEGTPAVRIADVVHDVDAAVRWASATSTVAKVDLIGWSWGAEVSGAYASLHSDRLSRLVLIAPIWDRRWPARHQTAKVWYPQTRAEMEKGGVAPIDRGAWDEVVRAMFASGDTIKLPAGPYRDIYGEDAPQWDARAIRAPVMVARGSLDRASVDENAQRLFSLLPAGSRYVVLGGSGHFPFLETSAHAPLARTLIEFLTAP